MDLSRRNVLKGSVATLLAGSLNRPALATVDPLPSWNEGMAKKAILDFVQAGCEAPTGRLGQDSRGHTHS